MVNTQTFRPAIAMIELIFALVIMGIVMMSAPMLISTATDNTFVALQQEGVNEAASRLNLIMGYSWDENNTDQNYSASILQVTNGHPDLNRTATTGRRVGTPNASSRTFIRSDIATGLLSATVPAQLGFDAGDVTPDDMDDFGVTTLNIVVPATVDYSEQNISITTAVGYMDDTFGGPVAGAYAQHIINFTPFLAVPGLPPGTSNIKSLAVTLTSTSGVSDLAKTITFRAFSCNIGAYKLEERVF